MSVALGSSTGQHDTATPFDASMMQWLHVAMFAGTGESRKVTAKFRVLVGSMS